MIPVQIQPFTNITGTLDLFTGIFYMIRVFSLGHGSIQFSETETSILEHNVLRSIGSKNLWYFQESPAPGKYFWKTQSQPSTVVVWDSNENFEQDEDNNGFGSSSPLILKGNVGNHEWVDNENALWALESHNLKEFNQNGTGFSIKSNSAIQGSGIVMLGSESTDGWWLQMDHEDPVVDIDFADECDSECLRSKADSIMIFTPTSFKLYGESNHLDIGEVSDLVKKVKTSKSYLPTNRILNNPTDSSNEENVTMETTIQYDLYAEPDEEYRFLSGIKVTNPLTNPSSQYYDFENCGTAVERKAVHLKATSYVKSTEEIELEPFSNKNISAYITYVEEFGGIRYSSCTNVSAQIDMMGDNVQVVKNVWVENVALLKHLLRSRGYQGIIKEVNTAPGERVKVEIKLFGNIRGSLPIPFIQFEEGPSTIVPQYKQRFYNNRVQDQEHKKQAHLT